jgi:DNA-binding response OmpR family regulator
MNDEQALLDLFQDLLEAEGYRVSTSIYLLDLNKVRELAPDVLVLDIMFAGDSKGWPFITMARVDRELSLVPIVLCTAAVTTVEPMLDRLAAQRVRIVYKPFDLEELLAAIEDSRRGTFRARA